MSTIDQPSDIHDLFHVGNWKAVVAVVEDGQVLSSPRLGNCPWSLLFPDGVSKECAAVLKKCNFDKIAHIGKSLMHDRCEQGDSKSVESLLDIGVSPCAPGDFNMCPLVYAMYGASFNSCSVNTVELLLSRGADPNALGLGSTGRASFVFLEVLPGVFSKDGWEGVDRLWNAFSPRVDWSLRYESNDSNGSPLINYFLMDLAARRKNDEPAVRELFRDTMQRLMQAGVSFEPDVRDLGYPPLGKYAAKQGGLPKWLMNAHQAELSRGRLDEQTAIPGGKRPLSRL